MTNEIDEAIDWQGRQIECGTCAHRELFADHPPATSMVEVKSLIDPAMLIEIEADAVVPTSGQGSGKPGDVRRNS